MPPVIVEKQDFMTTFGPDSRKTKMAYLIRRHFKTSVRSTGFSRKPKKSRLEAVLQTLKTSFTIRSRHTLHLTTLIAITAATILFANSSNAQTFNEDFSIWPVDLRINGTIIACSGPEIDEAVVKSFTASGKDEKGSFVAVWFDSKFDIKPFQELLDREQPMKQFGHEEQLPTDADSAEYQSLKQALESATGVLLVSSRPLSSDNQSMLTKLGDFLHGTIAKGGVVCGVGPVADHFGKFRRLLDDDQFTVTPALNLIPDGFVHTDHDEIDQLFNELLIEPNPAAIHSVGIGIPSGAAAVLHHRKFRTIGKKKVTFSLAANDRQPPRIQHLAEAKSRRSNPYTSVVDLTAWRRDAIERRLPPFPSDKPPTPDVENGTLFIVGGGGTPKGLMQDFVDLAGGDEARLIFVPCTHRDTVSPSQRTIRQWKAMGVASADILHTKDRNKANTDNEFLEPLSKATGIWFGGGRQWNFVDSYYGTKAHKLMKDVLNRGGVIGGSSAGASVQGDYLARANPVANFDIMAPGYERGLGFLTGVAIDQHFSQRGRQKDMTKLVDRYPQLLGIGIDESTALKVRRSEAEVIGRGKVFFYDRRQPVVSGEDDYIAVEAKSKFNLAERKIIEP